MNPVRANIVAHPEEYRWSSYGANARAAFDAVLSPHMLYESLGADAPGRQTAYRELFRHALESGLVDEIRKATNGNYALGNDTFANQVSTTLGRRVVPGKAGRPHVDRQMGSTEPFHGGQPK